MHLLVYRVIPSEGDGIVKPTRAFFIRYLFMIRPVLA
jgi:hypothetical protein